MNHKEFRIGNYLTSKQWMGLHQIDGIESVSNGFVLKVNGYPHIYEDGKYFEFAPASITEDILFMFGFRIHSDYSFRTYVNENGWSMGMWMQDKPVAGFEEKGVCYWGDGYTPIKYVHQLQNLYFSLTGEELATND